MSLGSIQAELGDKFSGDFAADQATLSAYSHDASLFELVPSVVAYPRTAADIGALVDYVNSHKHDQPELSLTARSGGTDMSGGAINDSIIVAFERYFNGIGEIVDHQVAVQPGVYYRDLEPKTVAKDLLMPTYPASRDICMVGGMAANNAGGEKSLVYGKTDQYVRQVKIVLRDGQEHVFGPLSAKELALKLDEKSLEGDLYRGIYKLVTENQALLAAKKPRVSKNSTAYNLWSVWDGKTFDITKVLIGSQGTLGLLTEVTFKLVPAQPLSGMVVAFLPSLDKLGEMINALLALQPTSLESFDEHTIKFAFRFFLGFRKTLGLKRFILLGLSFIPVLNKLLRYFPHLPKIVLLIEFEGSSQADIDQKLDAAMSKLRELKIETQRAKTRHQEEKFWIMRRESFNILRKNVKRKHTAPFIDDLIVPPETLPEFLPKLTEILERSDLLYTVAGHMGDGNFHIIPLMDLADEAERDKIYPVLSEVTDLVLRYGGSLSGEHNDGLIRGPMLERMYGGDMLHVFMQVKDLFDPQNIFNPHKKTDATIQFSKRHIRKVF